MKLKSPVRFVRGWRGYALYVLVVAAMTGAIIVSAPETAEAQIQCFYQDCYSTGYPTPPCGNCGVWVSWNFYDTDVCFWRCGIGSCLFYDGECEFCSYTMARQCF